MHSVNQSDSPMVLPNTEPDSHRDMELKKIIPTLTNKLRSTWSILKLKKWDNKYVSLELAVL